MARMNPASRHRCLTAVFVLVAGLLLFAGPLAAQPGRKLPEKVPPKRSSQIQDGFGINSDMPRDPYLP